MEILNRGISQGKAEGNVAGADPLGDDLSGQPYEEAKAFDATPAAPARRLQNQAHALHLKRVPI